MLYCSGCYLNSQSYKLAPDLWQETYHRFWRSLMNIKQGSLCFITVMGTPIVPDVATLLLSHFLDHVNAYAPST